MRPNRVLRGRLLPRVLLLLQGIDDEGGEVSDHRSARLLLGPAVCLSVAGVWDGDWLVPDDRVQEVLAESRGGVHRHGSLFQRRLLEEAIRSSDSGVAESGGVVEREVALS